MTGGPSLIVGIDSAEPTLVRALIDAGRLPAIAGLLADGWWRDLASPAVIGSGTVWPTFMTGRPPAEHGVHIHPFAWSPSTMSLETAVVEPRPWWWEEADRGRRVLELDVPISAPGAPAGVTQVLEWGAHDILRGRVSTSPVELAGEIRRRFGRHPFVGEPRPPHHETSPAYRAAALSRAREGVRLRGELASWLLAREQPDLAVVAFPEWHHVAHVLWPETGVSTSPLADLLCDIDAQIGRLEASRSWGTVAVLSLHGMRAARGVPTILPPLLETLGYATPVTPPARQRVARSVKARLPEPLRQAWRRRAPPGLAQAVATASLPLALDWTRTRAFALPSDQNGWIRVNLAGRERDGIVSPGEFDSLCDELAATLEALTDREGRPVVERVLRTAPRGSAPCPTLPDLVTHWAPAAHADPLKLDRPVLEARPDARRLTGQHDVRGFVAARGLHPPPETLDVASLGQLFASARSPTAQ